MTIDDVISALAQRIAEQLPTNNPKATIPRLLSVKEAATYLGRSPHAIYRLIASGKIRTVRLDRHVAIDRHDLDLMIDREKH